jgi:aspartate oxidase
MKCLIWLLLTAKPEELSRNLDTGEIERHAAHAVILATGGYGKIYYLSPCHGM